MTPGRCKPSAPCLILKIIFNVNVKKGTLFVDPPCRSHARCSGQGRRGPIPGTHTGRDMPDQPLIRQHLLQGCGEVEPLIERGITWGDMRYTHVAAASNATTAPLQCRIRQASVPEWQQGDGIPDEAGNGGTCRQDRARRQTRKRRLANRGQARSGRQAARRSPRTRPLPHRRGETPRPVHGRFAARSAARRHCLLVWSFANAPGVLHL